MPSDIFELAERLAADYQNSLPFPLTDLTLSLNVISDSEIENELNQKVQSIARILNYR